MYVVMYQVIATSGYCECEDSCVCGVCVVCV